MQTPTDLYRLLSAMVEIVAAMMRQEVMRIFFLPVNRTRIAPITDPVSRRTLSRMAGQ